VRDVRGGGALHLSISPFLCAGEVGESEGPPRRLLLLDKARFGRGLHPLPWRRKVGEQRDNWVIASAEANDRLALPSDGPRLDRKQWRAKPSLAPEFQFVLDRIKILVAGGLTSMHVVGDFLKRRIAPLQQRARLCCWFTGSNDIGRIQRGPGTDMSWEELEVLVKGITGESFVPESLILPEGIPALFDDAGLRTVILATLPTLDERAIAVRQTGGRDPHRGIRISDAPAGGPQTVGMAPSTPARASHASVAVPHPLDKGKGAASSSSVPGGAGVSEEERRRRLRRANVSFALDPPDRNGGARSSVK
jgi:hypothetical protein